MDKSNKTVRLFGVDIPRYKDCSWCGAKDACAWGSFAYNDPCDKCKATEKYQKMQDSKKYQKGDAIGEVFKAKQIAGVWEYKGRNIYTNYKGDVISDEPYRPLATGRKDWKK